MIDKKQYMGGKIEVRTEYYTLVMRKKETKMA
jgi:Fe2+ transport system protein FeoA